MLPLAAAITGRDPTGRDVTMPGWTILRETFRQVGEGSGLRARGFAQRLSVRAGAVVLDVGGDRQLLRAGAAAVVPARALHAVLPLASGSVVEWEPVHAG